MHCDDVRRSNNVGGEAEDALDQFCCCPTEPCACRDEMVRELCMSCHMVWCKCSCWAWGSIFNILSGWQRFSSIDNPSHILD